MTSYHRSKLSFVVPWPEMAAYADAHGRERVHESEHDDAERCDESDGARPLP